MTRPFPVKKSRWDAHGKRSCQVCALSAKVMLITCQLRDVPPVDPEGMAFRQLPTEVTSEGNRVTLFLGGGGGGPYLKLLARFNKGLAHDLSS